MNLKFSPVSPYITPDGAGVRVHLLNAETIPPGSFTGHTVLADIQGRTRELLAQPVQMAAAFNRQNFEREKLRQDCAVFAAAVVLENDMRGMAFHREAGYSLRPASPEICDLAMTDNGVEPVTKPGDVVVTMSPNKKASHHFMVRASVDDEVPLYLSKFGSRMPVLAHSFNDVSQIYPTDMVCLVRDFEVVPFHGNK